MPDRKRSRSRSRSRSRNRSRGMPTRFIGRTRSEPREIGSYSTELRASFAGLDRNLVHRPASGACGSPFHAQPFPLAPNVGANAMIANWVVGEGCSLFDFAHAIKASVFDLTVVTVTKEITSMHSIFKFLENLTRVTASPFNPLLSHLDRWDVTCEKAVVSMENAVW